MRATSLLPLLPLFVACGAPQEPALPPGAATDQELITANQQLTQQALAFFSPLPERVEHPAGPDTPEKVALGRKLFLDPQLSEDGTISCNSCHRLDTYGVDYEPTSPGMGGQRGGRNSPTVYNAALHNMQFWDGRAADVEEQAGGPVLNPIEMGVPSEAFLLKRLKDDAAYPGLFAAAFPAEKEALTFANLREAIGAFERTLLTPSRFDAFLKGDATALTPSETAGLRTFMEVGCTACHNGAAVGGTMLQKFGIHADFRALTGTPPGDEGRKEVTHAEADKDLFKVPGLRNVTRTAPYFHNGRVPQLDSAIRVMGEAQLGVALTDQQVTDLRAFLEALTGTMPGAALK